MLVKDNSTGNDQIIATADIQSIEDLGGTTIGVEVGVVDHFLLLLGLESVGLTAADVNIVNLETGAGVPHSRRASSTRSASSHRLRCRR